MVPIPIYWGGVVSEYCYCDKLFGGCCPDGTNEDNNASDDNGHGTHVAGIIASQDSLYKGIAYNVDIYSVKVLDKDGKGKISDFGKAVDWCNNQGVDIISMSIGDGEEHPGDSDCPEAIDEQISNASANNIILVASAGNEGYSGGVSYPACNDNIISVGATDKEDDLASYSNVGPNLDLLAPGGEWMLFQQTSEIVSLFSTRVQEDEDLCFIKEPVCFWIFCYSEICYDANFSVGDNYIRAVGTSMSTPMVAGAVALMLDKNSSSTTDYTLTPAQIKSILKNTGANISESWKRLDVEAALEDVGAPCECTSWSLSGDCGDDSCDSEQLPYTRTCTDSCDIEFKCEYDETCVDQGGEVSDCNETGYEYCWEYEDAYCDVSIAVNMYENVNDIQWGEVNDSWDPYVIGNYTFGWKDVDAEQMYYGDGVNETCEYGGCEENNEVEGEGTMATVIAPGIAEREMILGYDQSGEYACWIWNPSDPDFQPSYGAGNPIYVLECYDDDDCSSSEYCDKDGDWDEWECVSKLSNGQSCSSDSVCLSGYCDNDGIGLADDGWCFAPYNNYFDGQETSYCEISTGSGDYQCDEKSVGTDLDFCSGVAFYEDECSSSCGLTDIISVFECDDSGCSCSEALCDGLSSGDNITTCSSGETYFADKCTSSAEGEDREDNICRSSSFAENCTADSECNGVEAGTGLCNEFCNYNDEPPSNSTIISPNGGEELNESATISWTESVDPNNDFVRYFLQYSNDSGTNWFNIISNYGFENKLNDSSTEKELTFSGNETQTVYLRVPKNATVTYAKFKLGGYLNE